MHLHRPRTLPGLTLLVVTAGLVGCRPGAPEGVTAPAHSLSPPTGLTATPTAADRIDLSWSRPASADDGIAGYRVYRDGEVVAEASGTSHADRGLSAFTEYRYRVTAVDSSGAESDPSVAVTARTLDGAPPSAPSGLSATVTGSSTVELSWSAASDPETGIAEYRVYRDGAVVATVTGTSHADTGLDGSTKYVYEVSAVNGEAMEGPRSAPATATTEPEADETPPTAPSDLTATVTGSSTVELSWSAASDPESGIAEYQVYRDGAVVATVTGTSHTDAGLDGSTKYVYEVSAVNGEGQEGPRSAAATATTEPEADETPPTAPSGLGATVTGSSTVELSWSAASDPESGIAEYRVYRDGTVVATTDVTDHTDTGLSASTEYTYEVSAVNGEGLEGPKSASVSVTTELETDETPPTAPSGLTATATGTSTVELSWSAASDPESGIAEYRVYRDGAVVDTTDDTDHTDTGLEAFTRYEYEVSAVNGEGLEGPKSDAVTVRTDKDDDDDDVVSGGGSP